MTVEDDLLAGHDLLERITAPEITDWRMSDRDGAWLMSSREGEELDTPIAYTLTEHDTEPSAGECLPEEPEAAPPSTAPSTLPDAVIAEMARVREVRGYYLDPELGGAGAIVASLMGQDLDMAARLLAEQDAIGLMRILERLKGWQV